MRVLVDRRHLGVEADQIGDLASEGAGDHIHAPNRLEQRGLEIVFSPANELAPHARLQQLVQGQRC